MTRLDRVRREIAAAGVDALAVASGENRRYLSGFTGSEGILWVTADDAALIADFRYWEQAAAQAPDWRLVRCGGSVTRLDALAGLCEASASRRLGIEAGHLTVERYNVWRERLRIELVPLPPLVERLREVKDAGELAAIARAAELADAALEAVADRLRPGVSEADVARAFEIEALERGAEGLSFPTIVASGPRGSLPHATPTARCLQRGELVTLDYGVRLGGYASDATRTWGLGRPDGEGREAHDVVLAALDAGLAAVRPGVRCVDVDAAARDVIAQAGRAEQFGHALGHGVGLDVHEAPRLSQRSGNATLEEGMVVTVEPGVYVPGRLGVRVEELVVVEAGGPRILTSAPRGLRTFAGL